MKSYLPDLPEVKMAIFGDHTDKHSLISALFSLPRRCGHFKLLSPLSVSCAITEKWRPNSASVKDRGSCRRYTPS
jgi:hypothetical protein